VSAVPGRARRWGLAFEPPKAGRGAGAPRVRKACVAVGLLDGEQGCRRSRGDRGDGVWTLGFPRPAGVPALPGFGRPVRHLAFGGRAGV